MSLLAQTTRVFAWMLQLLAFYDTAALPLHLPCEHNAPLCGRPVVSPASSRIIGGQAAVPGSWPWMVSLEEDGFNYCGGALISEDIVLTATHCFLGKKDDPTKWTAILGRYRLDRASFGQITVKIKEIIKHPEFNITTVANDIALVVLSKRVTSDVLRPICVPPEGQEVKVREMCLLAGFGATRGTADRLALNQVALPIVSDATCAQPDWYGEAFTEPSTTFCAGYEQGLRDGCQGDSGGPLICLRENVWYVQGISSWAYGCAERKWPGVYTEVDKYAGWIYGQVALLRRYCSGAPIIG